MLHTDPNTLPGLDPTAALATLTPADADRFRITVQQDAGGTDGPLQWGGITCVSVPKVLRFSNDDTPDDGADPLDVRGALDRLSDGITPRPGHWADAERSADAVVRWARIFHGRTVARWNLSIDQSTYVDGLVYFDDAAEDDTTADALAATLDTLTQWARGEVYTVTLDRNTAEDISDPDAAEWDTLDAIGGTYFDDDHARNPEAYGPAQAAAGHFGVPLNFARAVDVVELDPAW